MNQINIGTLKKLLIAVTVFYGSLLIAQEGEFKFENISVVNGLPENTIKCIYQDKIGFLWLGTRNGLVKYDGYSLQTFIPSPNDKRSGNIVSISEDRAGDLWVGTSGGLFRLERKLEKFVYYDLNKIDSANTNGSNIYNLVVDKHNVLWIASGGGLIRRVIDENKFEIFRTKNSSAVTYVFEDSKNNLLVGSSRGLFQFNRDSLKISEQKIVLSAEYDNRYWVTKIFEDKNNNLWLSLFGRGMISYNVLENRLVKYSASADSDYNISSNLVADLIEDDEGNLWIGTQNNGIDIINPLTGMTRSIKASPASTAGLASDNIQCLFQDNSGVIWIGTLTAGLNKINRSVRMFNRYNPGFKNLGHNNFAVSVIMRDSDSTLWLGFSDNGVVRYDKNTKVDNKKTNKPVGREKTFNVKTSAISEDRVGNIWIGTIGSGLKRFNKKTKKTDTFFNEAENRSSFSLPSIRSVTTDQNGNLYISTNFSGVLKIAESSLLKSKLDYEVVDDPYQLLNQSTILFIYSDKENYIWFGTDGQGLIRYDPATGFFDSYFEPEQGFDIILTLFEDSQNRMWCGTYYGGLFLFDPESGNKSPHLVENGIAKCAVFSILEDDQQNFWMGTDRGLAKYSPGTGNFKTYNKIDGVQGDQFLLNSKWEDSSGILYFGGQNGLNGFLPTDINEDRECQNIVFTQLKVLNDIVEPGEDSPISVNINVAKKIKLPYWQNDIQIEFAALDFSQSKLNQYSYYLENYDPEWIEIGVNRSANLTNLSPGNYILRVKACSKDGVWTEKSSSIEIIVETPPWLTWWAYLLYVLSFIGIVYSIIKYDITRTRLKYNLRLQESETEKLHELGQLKSRFFANISHEFRTPLTLILSPVQKLLQKPVDEESKKYFKIIQRNSTQLLNLVNQLLDLSKLDAGKMKLSLRHGEINKFLSPLIYSFSSLAENQKKNFEIVLPENNQVGYFDPEKIERVIINLLSNAFKFTNEGDTVTVKAEVSEEILQIEIKDSGLGIAEEKIHSIFDRFVQIEEHQTSSTQGTGLGLALVKELVELHNGKINVTSQKGEGTVFQISFPISLEKLTNYEVLSDLTEYEKVLNSSEITEENNTGEPVETKTDILNKKERPLVLVVEDNFELRGFINDSLSGLYNVIEAENGVKGIEKAREEVPDLIVSDLMMPEMDGLEMCNNIKEDERTSHIPLILLTAKDSDNSKLEGFEKGADDYITKPFNIQLLLVRIANLIDQRKRLLERYSKNFTPASLNLSVTSVDDRFMKKVYEVIDKNLTNLDFSVEMFGEELYMSRVQLYRKIKALTGKSVSELVRIYRLERAAELIKQNFGSITDVCYEVGFKEQTNFSTSFKKHFGKSPSEFKLELKNN